MKNKKNKDISDLLFNGIQLAYKRLLEKTAKEDGSLVVSENGKPRLVKAKELLKSL